MTMYLLGPLARSKQTLKGSLRMRFNHEVCIFSVRSCPPKANTGAVKLSTCLGLIAHKLPSAPVPSSPLREHQSLLGGWHL